MVAFAGEFDPSGLSQLSKHLLGVVAPEKAEALEEARLAAQEKRCRRERRVTFTRDGVGGVRVNAYLPVGEAEILISQLDARVNAVLHAQRAALDRGDSLVAVRTAAQLRADALLELGWFAASQGWAPGADGDRPRVLVLLYYDHLRALAEQHGLLASGEDIAPGDLRRLLVEADVLPVVLGGPSEVLDLGRGNRYADALQRVALALRDGGCVFPGCDMPPGWCHAHHTRGWRDGGGTNLGELALYCRHHHPIVEPRRGDPPWRWRHHETPVPVAAGLLDRIVDFMPRADASDLTDPYLAVLDEALSDRYLSTDENASLRALASAMGLDADTVLGLHREYLNALARVALADDHLSEEEQADLFRVAEILDLPAGAVPAALEAARAGSQPLAADQLDLPPGSLIVFTGAMEEPRELWMQRAADHGWVAHPTVTKQVALVVSADTDSLSGKAKKARGYGIPIMSIESFRDALGYPPSSGTGPNYENWGNAERQWARALKHGTNGL